MAESPRCPTSALGVSVCAQDLKDTMAAVGSEVGEACEIVVSTAPPLVVSPYGINGYTCPHGIEYWIEPTGDQVAEWNRAGTP